MKNLPESGESAAYQVSHIGIFRHHTQRKEDSSALGWTALGTTSSCGPEGHRFGIDLQTNDLIKRRRIETCFSTKLDQPDQLLTGDEAPLGQRRREMALAQADPPQRSFGITADRRLHQVIQGLQNPRLHPSRGLLSATLPANPLAAPQRPGAKIRWAAADGAARHSGGPRHCGYSAAAGRACFTRSEQASVSLVEEGSSASKRAWMASWSITPPG